MNLKTLFHATLLIACLLCSVSAMAAEEPFAVYTASNTTLTFYYDTRPSSYQGTVYDLNTGTTAPDWYDDDTYKSVTHVVFHWSFVNARPTSTYAWFLNMTNLQAITGLERLNTDDVVNMAYMFYGCERLTDIDLSTFNTANVTNMYGMFYGCSSLMHLSLGGFNTAHVTNMGGMFRNCSSLESIDLGSFNTGMVTKTSYMFSQCSNLNTIIVGRDWNMANVTVSTSMFEGCTRLVGGMGTAYDSNHIDVEYAHIDCGAANPGYLTDSDNEEPAAYAVYTSADSTLTFYYDNLRNTRSAITYDLNTDIENPGWSDVGVRLSVAHVVFDPSFSDARPTTTFKWFNDMSNLRSITGMKYLNTSMVTYMGGMFRGCVKLTDLDLSHFDTSNVTDMTLMFAGSKNLTNLDLTGFNTGSLTDMTGMFEYCTGLTNINLIGFNTSQVEIMDGVFKHCHSLKSLDLRTFNTAKVKDMNRMFGGCENLTTIYVSEGWTTEAVIYSVYMFDDCFNLVGGMGTVYDENHTGAEYAHFDWGAVNPGYFSDRNIEEPKAYAVYTAENSTLTFYFDSFDRYRTGSIYELNTDIEDPDWQKDGTNYNVEQVLFDPSFASARPTTTYEWFYNMTNLRNIEGMNYLNTSQVTEMSGMFYGCLELTSLDLSSFNTDNVKEMAAMFRMCQSLMNVDLGSFNTSQVADMILMFAGCENLTSLDLSSFNTGMVTDMTGMFLGASRLTTIYVGDDWSTAAVINSERMFENCNSLVGAQGTRYDAVHVDASYAHIDGGSSNPGYFTAHLSFIRGDVNGDGEIGVGDITNLIDYLLTGNVMFVNLDAADANQDTFVNISDIPALIDYMLRGNW